MSDLVSRLLQGPLWARLAVSLVPVPVVLVLYHAGRIWPYGIAVSIVAMAWAYLAPEEEVDDLELATPEHRAAYEALTQETTQERRVALLVERGLPEAVILRSLAEVGAALAHRRARRRRSGFMASAIYAAVVAALAYAYPAFGIFLAHLGVALLFTFGYLLGWLTAAAAGAGRDAGPSS